MRDQGRWNTYGKEFLDKLRANPEEYWIEKDYYLGMQKPKRDFVEMVGPLAGKKLLEVGSGLGHMSVCLAKNGAKVVGIDRGENLVVASCCLAQLNHVDCGFICMDAGSIGFLPETFDAVFGFGVLHHLSSRKLEACVRMCWRILREGGSAFFNEPIENSKIFDFLQNCIPNRSNRLNRPSILQRKAWKEYLKQRDERPLSQIELIHSGRRAGFPEIRFIHYGFLRRLVALGIADRAKLDPIDQAILKYIPSLRYLSHSVLVQFVKN